MTCKEAVEKGYCLGCGRLEKENPNADDCEYRIQNGLDLCKKIIEGTQMKL